MIFVGEVYFTGHIPQVTNLVYTQGLSDVWNLTCKRHLPIFVMFYVNTRRHVPSLSWESIDEKALHQGKVERKSRTSLIFIPPSPTMLAMTSFLPSLSITSREREWNWNPRVFLANLNVFLLGDRFSFFFLQIVSIVLYIQHGRPENSLLGSTIFGTELEKSWIIHILPLIIRQTNDVEENQRPAIFCLINNNMCWLQSRLDRKHVYLVSKG